MNTYLRLERNFIEHIKNKNLTGLVCGVYQGETEICRGVFGYQDCAQTQPIQEDAIFRLASMTKPITATAVLIAEESGNRKTETSTKKGLTNTVNPQILLRSKQRKAK